MKLLDAKPVRESKRQSEVERRELIRKLQEEERASVKRLNEALAAEEAQRKKRIAEDLLLAREEGTTAVKRSVLHQEIKTLEERKAEALKPIFEIRKEAEKTLAMAQASFADSQKCEEATKRAWQDVSERLESIADDEAENQAKTLELAKREEHINGIEEELKRSTAELSKKWTDFHTIVHQQNQEYARGKREIEASQIANKSYAESLDMKASELDKQVIALKDGFRELEKSHKEIQELRKLKT